MNKVEEKNLEMYVYEIGFVKNRVEVKVWVKSQIVYIIKNDNNVDIWGYKHVIKQIHRVNEEVNRRYIKERIIIVNTGAENSMFHVVFSCLTERAEEDIKRVDSDRLDSFIF